MLHFAESGSGAPVILLHAFPMDSTLWAPQRRALAASGYRVVTPDLPGFGGSAVSSAAPSLDVAADEVAALMDALGIERAVVGGLSMGGYTTMAMLRHHPERITAVILADTKASADAPEAAAKRLSMAESVLASGTSGLADAMLDSLLGETTLARRPEVVATVRRWIGAQSPAAVAWAQVAMAARPDSHADLAAFGGPVLIVRGTEDALAPAAEAASMAEAAESGGSRVTMREIPGVGHLSAVEDPDAVTQALAGWLGEG